MTAGALALVIAGCGGSSGTPPATPTIAAHSSSLALSADGAILFVTNPEADSVSEIDTATRSLTREILLAPAAPVADPVTGAFAPAVMPRAAALAPDGKTLYVTGERAGAVYTVDVASGTVGAPIPVGSEPVGLVVSPDGAAIFAACSQDAAVVKIDAASAKVIAHVAVPAEPWALAWSADGAHLLVTAFMGQGVTAIDPAAMTAAPAWQIPETAARSSSTASPDRRLAHGEVRGLYDLAARPGTDEIWVAHALLGVDTPQPQLDFESTAFPALSLLHDDGTYAKTLSTNAQDVPGSGGSFSDVVSGPHAVAFTPDGDDALVADANSGDVLVVDARSQIEVGLVRPLPGKMPDGIVISPDGLTAYVDERVSSDVAVLALDRTSGTLAVTVDGAVIPRVAHDPMPAMLRLGQDLFNSADSSRYPITTNHWISCATCHMEGRSDAVTWKFAQGPRDTPTNAGGMLGTGFLFRTADRTAVQDYWHTVNIEQGGRFDPTAQAPLLDAIAAYVNLGLPLPVPPTTDATLVARGAQVFKAAQCDSCHSGARFTDSGAGNPTLDLTGIVLLHDVGTCVTTGAFPDVAHEDVDGDPRAACQFDTPSLNGVASTPPYLHDGSAATLSDAVLKMPMAPAAGSADLAALVEYLRSL
ncbi:MAG TPA: di-heme oxidoredictase family protein [Polyangia bacterium]|nr:di-heme oxidoredictase family protein [Polyangia bacterium]